MGPGLTSVLYVVLLVSAVRASLDAYRVRPDGGARRPVATLAAVVVVGVPSLLQLTVAPGLLDRLERDRTAVAAGEVWRLVTSVLVQDGGWAGTAFNLASLLVVGAVAERVWGTRRWLVLALVCGVGAELWGLCVQPVGGGNSVVVFGLAGSLAFSAVRYGTRPARFLAAAGLLVTLVLLVAGDIHGGAATIGVATAAALLRDREQVPARP